MNTPRSGLRRAAIAAWLLAGVGAAGVAGTSKLVYAETLASAAEQTLTTVESGVQDPVPDPAAGPLDPDAAEAAPTPPPGVVPQPVSEVPAAPGPQTPANTPPPAYSPPPPSAPSPSAPLPSAPAPEYTAPAPALHPSPSAVAQAPTPSSAQGGFPIRKSHSPMGGGSTSGGNKVTPSHTASHGS